MPASIRRAEPKDVAVLHRLSERTFRETFLDGYAIPYPKADLEIFLRDTYGEAAFAATLADPAQAVWLVENEARAIGYATAGLCALPHPDVQPADGELKKIYVLEKAQGQGLGLRLLHTVLAWLEGEEPRTIWLGVWSGNRRAQQLYARHGFAKVGEYEFPVGAWRDHEFVFRRG